mmetsp:Transcript_12838/g.26654  ORF Transcript_12838/g.26654 Transcript_12838/m.26654 type:complete len:316 (+) Transcript_12838:61-1008(+)
MSLNPTPTSCKSEQPHCSENAEPPAALAGLGDSKVNEGLHGPGTARACGDLAFAFHLTLQAQGGLGEGVGGGGELLRAVCLEQLSRLDTLLLIEGHHVVGSLDLVVLGADLELILADLLNRGLRHLPLAGDHRVEKRLVGDHGLIDGATRRSLLGCVKRHRHLAVGERSQNLVGNWLQDSEGHVVCLSIAVRHGPVVVDAEGVLGKIGAGREETRWLLPSPARRVSLVSQEAACAVESELRVRFNPLQGWILWVRIANSLELNGIQDHLDFEIIGSGSLRDSASLEDCLQPWLHRVLHQCDKLITVRVEVRLDWV